MTWNVHPGPRFPDDDGLGRFGFEVEIDEVGMGCLGQIQCDASNFAIGKPPCCRDRCGEQVIGREDQAHPAHLFHEMRPGHPCRVRHETDRHSGAQCIDGFASAGDQSVSLVNSAVQVEEDSTDVFEVVGTEEFRCHESAPRFDTHKSLTPVRVVGYHA